MLRIITYHDLKTRPHKGRINLVFVLEFRRTQASENVPLYYYYFFSPLLLLDVRTEKRWTRRAWVRVCGANPAEGGWGGCGTGEPKPSLGRPDGWCCFLIHQAGFTGGPLGERVRGEKRGQRARIGWDQDQMPGEQWGFWKKCGRKRGARFVLPPHCRLQWGSSDLMKCIPKRGRQPRGWETRGHVRRGLVGPAAGWRGGGSDPLMDRPEQCGLSAGWEKPSIHPRAC